MTTFKPLPFLILGGLRDTVMPPYAEHQASELTQVLDLWKRARQSSWPKPFGDFGFNWSEGPMVFMKEGMEKSLPQKGFLLYGFLPFEEKVALHELTGLATFIGTKFGLQVTELHFMGHVISYRLKESGPAS